MKERFGAFSSRSIKQRPHVEVGFIRRLYDSGKMVHLLLTIISGVFGHFHAKVP
ncbi:MULTISPECIES: hypothetical protein [Brevundimonas]|jgi:hypothetical protein|uniref:hypothetical protein n=1 Tax=Brevundimonas TaxID=41275 RepID=UPI00174D2A77|nr:MULTISPECIES: hypothetical protein [Brevundimonas]